VPKGIEQRLRERRSGSAALLHPDLRGLMPTRELGGSPFPDRLRRMLTRILTVRGLPELLHAEDRNSMAHSIEARVPFLDHRLVELLFSLDGGSLIANSRTKAILRQALADLLPPVVRERTDKLGFVTPEGSWLRGPLGELAADVFASQSFRERGFVDPAAAVRRLEQHRRGELKAGFELWRALNVELWARTFLDTGTQLPPDTHRKASL
jgi:asparagine synthase (glutamine-hydrolysing)